MRRTIHVKTLAVLITASLGGVYAPVAWSLATVTDAGGSAVAATESDTFMIRFADPGAIAYQGGIGNLQATAAESGQRFNAKSADSLAYRQFLEQEQARFIADMKVALNRNVAVPHTYQITHSGIAAKLTAAEAAIVARLPGVVAIERDKQYELDTFRGPSFIGATDIWDGAVPTPATAGSFGKGVVIGVLDSGVNATHPSFANDARCGFDVSDVKLRSFVDCSASAAGVCTGANPLDTNGHGTHTASTSGGNMLDATATPPPAIPAGYTNISGVAPCATLRTYKVCPGSTCPGADIAAGLSNILIDGDIDVVNYSISGGELPWDPSESDRAFLDFVDNDIFVAASAGNTRAETPNPVGEVNHLGPWVMTVASSTHDENPVGGTLSADGPGTPPANTQNLALSVAGINVGTGGIIPIRVSPTNDIGCTATGGFPPGVFSGAAALIPRGSCSFEEKLNNAQAAGALVGFVYNNAAGALNMAIGGATLPAYGMLQTDGQALRAFITANGATPTTVNFVPATKIGDLLSDFSLRGPTSGEVVDLTKPDITAPGDNIYAAYIAPNNYAFLGGTSMSSPHTAGAGALVRAMNPTWSSMAIKSALQMTAKRTGVQEDATTQWNPDQIGNGRVQAAEAATAGLVLEETKANFLAANPTGGSIDIKELNIPSMRNVNCSPDCTFTRTVTSKLGASSTWNATFESTDGVSATVTPANFTIAAGGTQALTIVVTPDDYGPNNQLPNHPSFGAVVLTETGALSPEEHMTVAIRAIRDGIFTDDFDPEASPSVTVDEGFVDITTLEAAGWTLVNRSTTVGTTTWFQGNPDVFAAQAGNPAEYIGANFNSTTGNSTISTWLISPIITFNGDSAFSFQTRAAGDDFPDRLEVRLCTTMPCTDLGVVATGTGAFSTLIKSINPTLSPTDDPTGNAGYPIADWAPFAFNTSSAVPLPSSGQGRIAMRYFVTGGGPSGANSNYIGIDTLSITGAAITPTGAAGTSGVTNIQGQTGSR